jgi:hypothetical protein
MEKQNNEATTFDPTDAPLTERLDGVESKRNQYRRFKKRNTLRWKGKWADQVAEDKNDRKAIVSSVAGQLELSDIQRKSAENIFTEIREAFENNSHSVEILAVVSCGIAGWKDGRDYHPNNNHPDHFARQLNNIGVGVSEYSSVWHRVLEVTDV